MRTLTGACALLAILVCICLSDRLSHSFVLKKDAHGNPGQVKPANVREKMSVQSNAVRRRSQASATQRKNKSKRFIYDFSVPDNNNNNQDLFEYYDFNKKTTRKPKVDEPYYYYYEDEDYEEPSYDDLLDMYVFKQFERTDIKDKGSKK